MTALHDAIARLGAGHPTYEDLVALIDAAAGGRLVEAEAPAPTIDPLAERDELLRHIRQTHYSDKKDRPAAEAMATDLLRYQASAWRNDRRWPTCPHPQGSLKADQWRLLSIGTAVPAWRRLVDILRG